MRLKEIFCPFCGNRTKVDEDKAFCFCLECGSKIENIAKNSLNNKDTFELEQKKIDNNKYLDGKLKEVDFYMDLSKEKKEYLQLNYEPTYYIKAQDILLELSEQFPNEYKIWWELCKPLDFDYPFTSGDEEGRLSINEVYFNKALDFAKIENKRELIIAHDNYIEEKRKFVSKKTVEKEEKEKIKKEEKRRREEEERRRKEEEERAREEAEIREEERKRRIEREQAIKREEAKRESEIAEQQRKEEIKRESPSLWEKFENKDYSSINESYFQIRSDDGANIIGIFKLISNILYLISYRQDKNGFIADQTIGIRFNSNGIVYKFDNKPVKMKGNGMTMQLLIDSKGNIFMNEYPVMKDSEYVKKLVASSKKPIISFRKTFC